MDVLLNINPCHGSAYDSIERFELARAVDSLKMSYISRTGKRSLRIIIRVDEESEKYFSLFIQEFVQNVLIETDAQLLTVFITPNSNFKGAGIRSFCKCQKLNNVSGHIAA